MIKVFGLKCFKLSICVIGMFLLLNISIFILVLMFGEVFCMELILFLMALNGQWVWGMIFCFGLIISSVVGRFPNMLSLSCLRTCCS